MGMEKRRERQRYGEEGCAPSERRVQREVDIGREKDR